MINVNNKRSYRTEELKPCPFCGGAAVIVTNYMGGVKIRCKNASACSITQEWWDDEEDAFKAWNKRAEPKAHYPVCVEGEIDNG